MNLPPVSGALFWVRGLIDRIEEPMAKLKQTMRLMLDSEEAKEVSTAPHTSHYIPQLTHRTEPADPTLHPPAPPHATPLSIRSRRHTPGC